MCVLCFASFMFNGTSTSGVKQKFRFNYSFTKSTAVQPKDKFVKEIDKRMIYQWPVEFKWLRRRMIISWGWGTLKCWEDQWVGGHRRIEALYIWSDNVLMHCQLVYVFKISRIYPIFLVELLLQMILIIVLPEIESHLTFKIEFIYCLPSNIHPSTKPGNFALPFSPTSTT